jgi:hypothetical protein
VRGTAFVDAVTYLDPLTGPTALPLGRFAGVFYGQATVTPADLGIDVAFSPRRVVGDIRSTVLALDYDPMLLGFGVVQGSSACVLRCTAEQDDMDITFDRFKSRMQAAVGVRQTLDVSIARPFTRFDFTSAVRTRIDGGAWSAPTTSLLVEGWGTTVDVEYATTPGGGPLVVVPRYGMIGSATVRSFLTLDVDLALKVLHAEMDRGLDGGTFDWLVDERWSLDGQQTLISEQKFEFAFDQQWAEPVFLGAPIALPTPTPVTTPEPATLVLVAGGLLAVACAARLGAARGRPPS